MHGLATATPTPPATYGQQEAAVVWGFCQLVMQLYECRLQHICTGALYGCVGGLQEHMCIIPARQLLQSLHVRQLLQVTHTTQAGKTRGLHAAHNTQHTSSTKERYVNA